MIKHPFTSQDLTNRHLLGLGTEVGRIVHEINGMLNLGDHTLILEEFGTILKQRSWTDDTGYYITFRPTPSYSHMPKVQEAVKELERKFLGMFSPQKSKEIEVTVHEPGDPNSRVTISLVTDSYTIGD